MPNDKYGTRTCQQASCGLTWTPIVPKPRVCPKCKSYRWEKPGKKSGSE